MYVCMSVCMCVCMYACMYVCMCVYVSMHVCMCVCMYVCMCVHMYVYIYSLSPQSLWPAINRCPYALCLDRPKNNQNLGKSWEPLKPYRNCTTELGLSRVRKSTTGNFTKNRRSRLSDSEWVLMCLKFSSDFYSKTFSEKLGWEIVCVLHGPKRVIPKNIENISVGFEGFSGFS